MLRRPGSRLRSLPPAVATPRPAAGTALLRMGPRVVCAFVLAACAAAPQTGGEPLGLRDRDRAADAPFPVAAHPPELAGPLCENATVATGCRCRASGDAAQAPPPRDGHKRFELRMSAAGGRAIFESELLGRFEVAGANVRCFYVDVPAGTTSRFRFNSVADDETLGVEPELAMTEYGPTGPYWYDVLFVDCRGSGGRCNREGADAWRDSLRSRQRGRLDPCGSAVVTNLAWDTTGGQHERDGGLYRDFTVTFALEVKTFATQFAPGSTECVPK